jgi:hypothetical protein
MLAKELINYIKDYNLSVMMLSNLFKGKAHTRNPLLLC